jgi:hypothetical protein
MVKKVVVDAGVVTNVTLGGSAGYSVADDFIVSVGDSWDGSAALPPEQPAALPAPDSLLVTPTIYANVLTWTASSAVVSVEIWGAQTNDLASSSRLAEAIGLTWIHHNIEPGNAWWYWLRGVDGLKNVSADTYPSLPTNGVLSASTYGLRQADTTPLQLYTEDADIMPTDIQSFTSNGTWTKPASGTTVRVECWGGGGGGGGGGATTAGGGGAGGRYLTRDFGINELPATVAITVGAGGGGGAASTIGGNGVMTSFGTYLNAQGGGGGGALFDVGRGAGGGNNYPGGRGSITGSGIAGGGGGAGNTLNGGAGDQAGSPGSASGSGSAGNGGFGINAGGGGGGCFYTSNNAGDGGDSTNGGGGGGGGASTNNGGGGGGLSDRGGNGGNGGYAVGASTPTAGALLGGGGGGGGTSQSGAAGGGGYCRVSVF